MITFGYNQLSVVESTKNLDGTIALMLGQEVDRPPVETEVVQNLDWDRRFHHMRLHTAIHLLTVSLPFPVTGGQISSDNARLDFNMPALAQTKQELQDQLETSA